MCIVSIAKEFFLSRKKPSILLLWNKTVHFYDGQIVLINLRYTQLDRLPWGKGFSTNINLYYYLKDTT